MMRWACWLDQLLERPRKTSRKQGFVGRPRMCSLASVECLETRTQLTVFTYSATDVPLQVPPGDPNGTGTTVSTIHVSDDFFVRDVNVQLNIQHTFDADLQAVLIAPDGTRLELFGDVGGSGENFTETIFDGQADQSIVDASAPFTSTTCKEIGLSPTAKVC